jgi:hypothetical protein
MKTNTCTQVITAATPNWFIDNFMSQVPVGTINDDLIKSVAIHQLKSDKNGDQRKIQIAEAIYDLCGDLNNLHDVIVYQYAWEVLKRSGTLAQKTRLTMAINACAFDISMVYKS